ncbi:MAG: hypothetical protein VKM01_02165 [Cyanobacteriota bacterium]|nr:hypothetical protein [Cyanobacteriota bacterium]
MAQRHWLDPLARRLLIATGQLSAPAAAPQPAPTQDPDREAIERQDIERQEALERDLLALRLQQQPGCPLRNAAEVARAAALGWSLDVNRATAADWLRLPGCQPRHADLLQRLRDGGVQLSGPDDLQRLLELDEATLAAWRPLLSFSWYADPTAPPLPTLALNQATARQLEGRLGLSPERLARLLRERRRAPFQDLADLQQRLQLPPALVEQWIGRVSFEPPGPGLCLPPAHPPGPPGRRGR